MQEHLKFNILNFNWPRKLLTFYVSLNKVDGVNTIHHRKFPSTITEVFSNEELEEVRSLLMHLLIVLDILRKKKVY